MPELLRDEVLHIIALGRGRHGWHAIASRLSGKDVPRVPELPEVLRRLREEGLVVEEHGARWRITEQGCVVLSARRTAPSSVEFARKVELAAALLHAESNALPNGLLEPEEGSTPDETAWLELLADDVRHALHSTQGRSTATDAAVLMPHRDRALATGDWRTFMEALREIEGLSPCKGMYFRGRAWQALGFHGLAAALYRRALRLEPHDHRIGVSLLNALADAEDWEHIEADVQDVRRNPSAHLELALTAEVAAYRAMLAEREPVAPSRYEDVARRLSELLAEPSSTEILPSIAASGAIAAAMCFDNAGIDTEARRFAVRATGLIPNSGPAWLVRGLIGHRHGSPRAREHLSEAARSMPSVVWPRVYLAHLAVLEGRHEECLHWCEEGLPLASSDVVRAALHEWRGISRAETGESRAKARADLKTAVVLDPSQPTYRTNLDAFDHAALPLRFELPVSEALRAQTNRALTFATPVELAA